MTNDRYSRQRLFAPIGVVGQQSLAESRVLLVGCGALGAVHAEMLTRAGVGKLRIVDRDFVEFTNLQRQTLYKESDAEQRLPKAIAAKNRLTEISSETEIEAIIADINNSNIESFIKDCDLVLDGTDNFQIRFLVNDACVKHSVNWIYGAAVSAQGTTMNILPGKTPCLRCVFSELPDAGTAPTCDTAGVIMPIISSIAAIQVAEALKILVGDKDSLRRNLMQIDIWKNEWRTIGITEPDPNCETCGKRNFEFLNAEAVDFSSVLCGRDAVQIAPPKPTNIDLNSLRANLSAISEIKQNEYLLRFTADGHEITVFRDGRSIIKGTDDVNKARSLYSRYIGN